MSDNPELSFANEWVFYLNILDASRLFNLYNYSTIKLIFFSMREVVKHIVI